MKVYKTGDIRNVALLSHSGAGKTTLVERLLFNTGVIQRMGKVQDGTASFEFSDFSSVDLYFGGLQGTVISA